MVAVMTLNIFFGALFWGLEFDSTTPLFYDEANKYVLSNIDGVIVYATNGDPSPKG